MYPSLTLISRLDQQSTITFSSIKSNLVNIHIHPEPINIHNHPQHSYPSSINIQIYLLQHLYPCPVSTCGFILSSFESNSSNICIHPRHSYLVWINPNKAKKTQEVKPSLTMLRYVPCLFIVPNMTRSQYLQVSGYPVHCSLQYMLFIVKCKIVN